MLCALWAGVGPFAAARAVELEGRPIAQVSVVGMKSVPEQLVRNQVRVQSGDPYTPDLVQQDVVRITHLGRFSSVKAEVAALPDGSIDLTYVLTEMPLLADVQVVGNKAKDDQELLELALLRPGDPVDAFLIDQALEGVKKAYEDSGYFLADITYDEPLLREQGILLLKVREGPLVRIRQIRYEGQVSFTAEQLAARVRSKSHIWIFRKGELSREALALDADRVREFYRDRGYLDAQVGRRIDLSPDQGDAVVTFFIQEGPCYLVEDVRVEGNTLFGEEQVRQTLTLTIGEPFSAKGVEGSEQALRDLYGQLGHIETRVQIERRFYEDRPRVGLTVRIEEGLPYRVGTVTVRGNTLTQDKVILRNVRGMSPGERFIRAGIEATERNLRGSSLFSESRVTVLGEKEDPYRDVLIEVKEGNTGSVSLGAGISSDSGLIGAIELTQRNFDLTDVPETFDELISGKAFRGAGQFFAISLQPGTERSLYSVSFREPYILESNLFLDSRVFYFDREREDYDERRFGTQVGVGRRFGDFWSGAVNARFERIDIADVDPSAPVDVFDVAGSSDLSSLGFALSRNSVDSRTLPTTGHYFELQVQQYGVLGGDYDLTRISTEYRKYWTLSEDFFERRTVLMFRVEVGYLFDEAPLFERFYAGGHRTFRGFGFRGAGPRGLDSTGGLTDEFVGGDWMFLLGLEYSYPIYEKVVRGVFFLDTGTVQEEFGLDEYRVTVGAGLRLVLPFLGQAPLALDLGFPILKEDNDDRQIFSFDFSLPF